MTEKKEGSEVCSFGLCNPDSSSLISCMMVSGSTYLPVKWVCCLLSNSQRSIIMKDLLWGEVFKNAEGCTDVQDVDLSSEVQRQGYVFFPHRVALRFEEWWSQTVSGDNPLTQTHSTWLVPLTKEERTWVTMFINSPLSSAFLGARPWFILKEKQIVQKVQTLPWKNPVQCGFRHLPSRKEYPDLPAPVLLVQAPARSAGARVFWGFLRWGRASRESLCFPELSSDAILGEAGKQKADILEGEEPSLGDYFLWTKDT